MGKCWGQRMRSKHIVWNWKNQKEIVQNYKTRKLYNVKHGILDIPLNAFNRIRI